MNLIQHRWVLPGDLQQHGVLFGGKLLSDVDADCTMAAHTILKPEAILTTVGMDRLTWHSPARVGDRLRMEYSVVHIGKTSITVFVNVIAINRDDVLIFTAYTTLVCIEDSRPHPVVLYLEPSIHLERLMNTPEWVFVEKLRQQRKED